MYDLQMTEDAIKPNQPFFIDKSFIKTLNEFAEQAFDRLGDKEFLAEFQPYLNAQYIYTFVFRYGDTDWMIYKRRQDFVELSFQVTTTTGIPAPNWIAQSPNSAHKLQDQMLEYLIMLTKLPAATPLFNLFIQWSGHVYNGLVKFGQVFLEKQSGGRRGKCIEKCKCRIWAIRNFIVHSQGVVYIDQTGSVGDFLPYDLDFYIFYGIKSTGHPLGINIETSHRSLVLRALDPYSFLRFLHAVFCGINNSDYMRIHRHDSFAPARYNCKVKFYSDGFEYFRDLAEKLLQAKYEVFITDWMLSPQFYLVRPVTPQTEVYRFDRIIQAISLRGVKVKIILFWQPKVLNNNSNYTKNTLQRLNPQNITVIRHPNTSIPFMWSHHEKIAIIDQQVAFVGGLDITYSRYDTHEHPLFDYQNNLFPGIEYTNERKQQVKNVEFYNRQHVRRDIPRMPWHDIAMKLYGEVVWDLSTHFIQYWNYALTAYDTSGPFLQQKKRNCCMMLASTCYQGSYYIQDLCTRCFPCCERRKVRPTAMYFEELMTQHPELQMEYAYINGTPNSYHHTYDLTTQSILNSVNRQKILKQERQAAFRNRKRERIAKEIDRGMDIRFLRILMNLQFRTRTDKERFNSNFLEFNRDLMSKRYARWNKHKLTVRKNRLSEDRPLEKMGSVRCQALRSASAWSIGKTESSVEFSIQIAYIQLIARSKHFIFIENQFFMSSTGHTEIKNKIAQAIIQRIKMAFQRNESFRVYIFMPLLPSFAGEINEPNATVMRLNLHWELMSITRAASSIVSKLQESVGRWQDYIQFLGLRNHGRFSPQSTPTTELIYIHSKMMIVDDDHIIIGSANINDRSMNGNRDSQIAIVSTDLEKTSSLINGQYLNVSKSIFEFRAHLWKQHFGLEGANNIDPASEQGWMTTRNIVQNNTDIYRKVFGCYPDNNMRTYDYIQLVKSQSNTALYDKLIHGLHGHVVEFPIYFLESEDLNKKGLRKEKALPKATMT